MHTRDAFERALELPIWPASSLHIAAWHRDLELVRSLVLGGADVTARAEDSNATPLDWAVGALRSASARKPIHDDVIDYLKSVMREANSSAD